MRQGQAHRVLQWVLLHHYRCRFRNRLVLNQDHREDGRVEWRAEVVEDKGSRLRNEEVAVRIARRARCLRMLFELKGIR